MNVVEEVQNGEAQLLDVRDKQEWRSGHAKGAVRISVKDVLTGRTDALDKDKPLYVYCASGGRSSMAVDYLNRNGFTATNIGGLGNWARAGGELER